MSFQKNPPWQKNVGMQNFQQQMSLQQLNQIGFLQNQLGFSTGAQPMLQMNQLVNQVPTVQYPTTRVNPMAFQQQPSPQQSNQGMQQQQQQQQQQSKYNANQKVFSGTGVVSKIQNDIGFIDDEVLFHKNVCVKGLSPKLGDHVLVEAAYNQNMPFKWNATRVQVLTRPNANSPGGGNMQQSNKNYNSVPPPRDGSNSDTYRNRRYSPERRKSPERRNPRSRDRRDVDEENERKRRRDDRDRERSHRPRESTEHKERSPVRKPSPKRRRVRVVPRYMVQIPKISLTLPLADIVEIKKRYQNLYVPSDFFSSGVKWIEAFPPNAPFSLNKASSFHVMSKEVAPLDPIDAVLDPPDADYLYSAKVMLMSMPAIQDIYKKCFARAEDGEKLDDIDRDFIHPTRLINFLVGLRGKNETMAIGGAWSKKLDGENPQSDPTVLIRTAIRTCKALTGIDLSNCTQWYRFVELYYRRSEQAKDKSGSSGGSSKAARIETTVIFLPDTSSIMPNRLEWDDVQLRYKEALQNFLTLKEKPADEDEGAKEIPVITISDDNDTTMEVSAENVDDKNSVKKAVGGELDEPMSDVVEAAAKEDAGVKEVEPAAAVVVNPDSSITDKDEAVAVANDGEDVAEANLSQLDPRNMKVAELRAELDARNLPSKGLKNQLVSRLIKALAAEADPSSVGENEENEDVEMTDGDVPSSQETSQPQETLQSVEETPQVVEEASQEKTKDDGEVEMNLAEMDMSEVTIIDEYDSTKCEEEKPEKPREKKKEEPKKLDEKERHQIEKRYQLPENPSIIVHPSKVAKSGKFDCTVMSLSVLLDYRPEDTKEHSFEVSLFAELFNEMLTRDFGFNIFKAINYFPPIKAKEETKDDDKKKIVKEADGEAMAVDEKSIESVEKKEVETEVAKDDVKEADKKDKKRHHEDSDDSLATKSDRSRSKREKDVKDGKETKVDRPKYVTAFPDLLLSFVYFDQTQCGYIFEKDLEDLFYTIGLNLSRSQVRKLAEKFVTRDSLYYRKLTDRLADVPYVNPFENISEEQLVELGRGNQIVKSSSTEGSSNGEVANVDATGGMVQFNGSLINIQQLLEQMRKAETVRVNTERVLVDLRQKISELTSTNNRNDKRIKDLNSDLKSMSRKLQDTESSLSSATRKYNDYYSVLTSINERVAPIIAKNEKSRDRSDRDRDRSERKKDSDKEKDKKSKDDEKPKELKEAVVESKKDVQVTELKEEPKVENDKAEVKVEETS